MCYILFKELLRYIRDGNLLISDEETSASHFNGIEFYVSTELAEGVQEYEDEDDVPRPKSADFVYYAHGMEVRISNVSACFRLKNVAENSLSTKDGKCVKYLNFDNAELEDFVFVKFYQDRMIFREKKQVNNNSTNMSTLFRYLENFNIF